MLKISIKHSKQNLVNLNKQKTTMSIHCSFLLLKNNQLKYKELKYFNSKNLTLNYTSI